MRPGVAAGRLAAVAACALAGAGFAAAQEAETFPRVYPWETPMQGWLELTLWETFVASSSVPYGRFGLDRSRARLWGQSVELEYGLTDRLALALYADFERPDAHAMEFTRGRVEARYRFFDRYQRWVDPALYVEWYFTRAAYGAPESMEARLILERDLGDVRLDLNPVLSRALSGDESRQRTAFGVAAGAYYRRLWRVQPGIELFWNTGEIGQAPDLDRQFVLLSPSLDLNLTQALSLHLGAAFGLTAGSDGLMVRSYLTYQFETVRPSNQQQ